MYQAHLCMVRQFFEHNSKFLGRNVIVVMQKKKKIELNCCKYCYCQKLCFTYGIDKQ